MSRRILTFVFLIGFLAMTQKGHTQTTCPPEQNSVDSLFACMDSAERVGQLFIVSFPGDTATSDSDIARLILDYNVGGVVLLPQNENVTERDGSTAQQLLELTAELQNLALSETATLTPDGVALGSDVDRTPLPLFIAVQQEGDGAPYSSILSGLTQLPSNMAIGATWNPEMAMQAGSVLGRELDAVGINMLLGPSLDVLANPDPNSNSDLGTRSFGGDPYWVGRMGESMIKGIYSGSQGRVAVIAKHLPGYGGSDRPTDQEIATVRKLLPELEQIDLVPFFSATNAGVDGMMTTHIRFPGLTGNIRASADPVTVSAETITTLLSLPQFAPWRETAGLMLSDSLGVPSIQRFYNETGSEFPHRQVAKDAFGAGNDMLLLTHFALGGETSSFVTRMDNMRDTLQWFQERYETEPEFHQQVDASVKRILQQKIELYDGDFSADNILPDRIDLAQLLTDSPELVDLPAQAITLLSPEERLPAPPTADQNIVIFTDLRFTQQCLTCNPEPLIPIDALQNRISALYGPDASGQIDPSRITTFTFADLASYLNLGDIPITIPTPEPTPESTATPVITPTIPITATGTLTATLPITPVSEATPTLAPTPIPIPFGYPIQQALRNADLIVFAMLDVTDDAPNSAAIKRFLAERPSMGREASLVAFAYNAPYFLDATEITKLDAYYGIYSKTPAFIDGSIRALFGDLTPNGNPPISIEGIGYDLFDITQPTANQRIPLFIVRDSELIAPPPDQPYEVTGGESVTLTTGIIVDANGNTVPDGTEVVFTLEDFTETLLGGDHSEETIGGVARYNFILPEQVSGQIRISVVAGNAGVSDTVTIDGNQAVVFQPTPTATSLPTPTPIATPVLPTVTPIPTNTPTVQPTSPPTNTPETSTAAEPSIEISRTEGVNLLGFLGGLALVGLASVFSARQSASSASNQLRLVLWMLIGACLFYIFATLGIFATSWLPFGDNALLTTAIGGLLGWLVFRLTER